MATLCYKVNKHIINLEAVEATLDAQTAWPSVTDSTKYFEDLIHPKIYKKNIRNRTT